MRTRPAFAETDEVRAFRARLGLPRTISIDGASAYWLEDSAGKALTEESDSSAAPLSSALAAIEGGSEADDLVLVCRLMDGQPYRIGGGDALYAAALAAAGRPPLRHGQPGRKASA